MSYEFIAILMFTSMMVMLLTGQRVFGAIGFVAVVAALFLWGDGGSEMAFSAAMTLPMSRMDWAPVDSMAAATAASVSSSEPVGSAASVSAGEESASPQAIVRARAHRGTSRSRR